MTAPPIDFSKLTPCAEFREPDPEEAPLIDDQIRSARTYLSSFEWCGAIEECYISDIVLGGIVGVFLFQIEPASPAVDHLLWVVVGDVPPAYLVVDESPNAASALDAYIGEMERWIEAVKGGEPVDDLIPVEPAGGGPRLDPTREVAENLERRMRFLETEILAHHAEDLGKTGS